MHNHVYEDIATKFFEHFLHHRRGHDQHRRRRRRLGLWDEEDQFYYDELNLPDGRMIPLRVRSMVGLIPLFAVEMLEPELLDTGARIQAAHGVVPEATGPTSRALVSRWDEPGRGERRLLSLLRGHRMKTLLPRMLDETEFLSDLRRPRAVASTPRSSLRASDSDGACAQVDYEPARIGLRPVRRQLELARADLVSGQLPDHRIAAEVPPLLRRRFQGGMPDRLRQLCHHLPRSPPNCRTG